MIVPADLEQRGLFVSFWRDLLTENYALGGDIPPSERNLSYFAGLFSAYVSGEADGLALFAWDGEQPIGALLWGDMGQSPLETRHGRFAVGHGTYVAPERRKEGWSKKLRAFAEPIMKGLGFESVLGSAILQNRAGIESGIKAGFQLYGVMGVIKL